MASEVEKRLQEIEAYVYSHEEWKCDKHHKPENLKCEALWLCARLRDALAVIAQAPLAEATAAYRRLFGHAEVGEMLPAKLPLGHPYSTFVDGDDGRPCTAFLGHGRVCGQPRSAHEPLPTPTPAPPPAPKL